MRTKRIYLSLLTSLVTFAAATTAFANGAALPDTLTVALRPEGASEVGLEANFGWLSSTDGGPFTWVCHETVLPPTSQLTPYFYFGPNATYITVRSIGQSLDPEYSLYRSLDGCDYEPPAALEGINIREIAFDPSDADRALATSFNGSGASNGVWFSEDNGATWAQTALFLPQRFFRSVKFSPANPDRVWATATWFSPAPQAWVYRSNDGGVSWEEIPWVFTVGTTLQATIDIVAVSPTDQDVAFIRANGGRDYLLRTENGGDTWDPVFTIEEDIRGVSYTPEGDRVWIATTGSGLFFSLDGRNFEELATQVAARGVSADERGLWVVSNNYTQFALGHSTNEGVSFSSVLRFHEIGSPRPCPAGTDVAVACEPLWPSLVERLGITTPTPTPTPPAGDDDDDGSGGCACSLGDGPTHATPAASIMITLMVALAASRRRAR